MVWIFIIIEIDLGVFTALGKINVNEEVDVVFDFPEINWGASNQLLLNYFLDEGGNSDHLSLQFGHFNIGTLMNIKGMQWLDKRIDRESASEKGKLLIVEGSIKTLQLDKDHDDRVVENSTFDFLFDGNIMTRASLNVFDKGAQFIHLNFYQQ